MGGHSQSCLQNTPFQNTLLTHCFLPTPVSSWPLSHSTSPAVPSLRPPCPPLLSPRVLKSPSLPHTGQATQAPLRTWALALRSRLPPGLSSTCYLSWPCYTRREAPVWPIFHWTLFMELRTFLVVQTVKASVCNAGDPGLIPGLGRSSGEGNGNPPQYSCLENPMDRKSLVGSYSPWGRKESHTTERLNWT